MIGATSQLAVASLFFFFLSLVGGGWAEAGTLKFAWDRPRMSDGADIPCEAHILYRVYHGPTSRGTLQFGEFTYPSKSVRTNMREIALTVSSGKTRCFTINGYLATTHRWKAGGKSYELKAGEGSWGKEVCLKVP